MTGSPCHVGCGDSQSGLPVRRGTAARRLSVPSRGDRTAGPRRPSASAAPATGASQVAKITNKYLISAWAGYSVFAENAKCTLISGNTILWACNITLTA
ncbi:hypothetical protein [Streptomyces sp. NPDC054783]